MGCVQLHCCSHGVTALKASLHCVPLQATLCAKIGRKEVSTMVSTSDLAVTQGRVLHQLTARALIRDWIEGSLAEDRTQHEVRLMCVCVCVCVCVSACACDVATVRGERHRRSSIMAHTFL